MGKQTQNVPIYHGDLWDVIDYYKLFDQMRQEVETANKNTISFCEAKEKAKSRSQNKVISITKKINNPRKELDR